MSGAQSISTRRAYGVQRVCRVWHCARSSVYARRQATPSPAPCRRRGPVGAAPDDVLVAHVRRVLEASPFHGEGYRKVWAKLRVEGRRTSKERVRRLMREHDLQAPQRAGHAHGPTAHDGTITTEAPDVMWGTDMTATVTVAEGPAFVFVAVDHCTAECIGLHAAKRGTRFEALEPIRQGIRDASGASATAWPVGCGCVTTTGRLGRRFSTGGRVLRHRKFPELRAGARRQRRRGALHPHAEGESVVGAELRDHRGTPPGLACVQADIQRTVDAGEIRLSKPRPGATRPRRAGRGSVEANTVKPLSKNPGALHRLLKGEGVRCPFHMTHFVLGRGAFGRWKDDDARRVATVKRLTHVIKTHVHKSVSTGVTIADFRRVEKDFDFAAAHLTPYSLCATESIVRVERWRMFYTPRKNARIAFVLEAGDYDQHTLQLRLQAIDPEGPTVQFRQKSGPLRLYAVPAL